MLPPALLNQSATIIRRQSSGRDSLNNPTYGQPTSGEGWSVIYTSVLVRLAFSGKPIKFAPEGERIQPTGVVYYNPGVEIHPEDRVLVFLGKQLIEYNVISVVPGSTFGSTIDHWEAIVQLP